MEADVPNQFNNKRSCALETVTLVPISTELITKELLTPEELVWLNTYHDRVRRTLLPIMEKDFPEAVAYLIERTESI